MKTHLLTSTLVLISIFMLSTNSKRNPNNPPTGNTGAPTEETCGRSGCHNGGTFQGTVKITGIPDSILANQTYPITVTGSSATATRAGFQMTAMNGSTNAAAGTFTAATGVNIGTGNNRQYPRQSTPKNFAAGAVSWTFNWKAPATLTDPKVRFYCSLLLANGNGGTVGDNVVLTADTTTLKATVSSQDLDAQPWVTFGHQNSQLRISLHDAAQGQLAVHSLTGAGIMYEELSNDQLISTAHLPSGVYIALVSAKGKTESFKFFID